MIEALHIARLYFGQGHTLKVNSLYLDIGIQVEVTWRSLEGGHFSDLMQL